MRTVCSGRKSFFGIQVVLVSCLLVACANLSDKTEETADGTSEKNLLLSMSEPGTIKIQSQFISYDGWLNEANNKRLFEVFDSAEKTPTWLTVNSRGGSVEYGLELGEWIVENGLSVYIPQLCASSCANYVFTAGKQVVLNENAIIGWHGSPVIDDLVAGTPQAKVRRDGVLESLRTMKPDLVNPRRFWNKIRIRNRRFFRKIGVHPVVTSLTEVADESSLDRIRKAGTYSSYLAYLSIEDMKYFGIDHVRVNEGKAWNPDPQKQADGLIKITLVDDIENRLADIKQKLDQVQ